MNIFLYAHTLPKKSIRPFADFSYKSLIFQHPKKCMIFDKFLLKIMENASKRVFVQKFQLTLILQGFEFKDLKKRVFSLKITLL